MNLASLMLTDEQMDKFIKSGVEHYGDSGPVPYTEVDTSGLLRAAIANAVDKLETQLMLRHVKHKGSVSVSPSGEPYWSSPDCPTCDLLSEAREEVGK